MDEIDKPRLLFLDDSEERQLYAFRHLREDFRLDCVWDADECIEKLLDRPYIFDMATLDHDLGGRQYVPTEDTNTGSEVARAFKDGRIPKEKWPKKILIHSWNTVGAEYMRLIFVELGIPVQYKPFKV